MSRLQRIRRSLKNLKGAGFLVTDLNNIRYLTGFSGSSGFALISMKENVLATDFRYKEQAFSEVSGWDIFIEKNSRIKSIKGIAKSLGLKSLWFESSLSYAFFKGLSERGLELKASGAMVEKLREIKDKKEMESIREAVRRAEKAFLEVRPYIRAGASERGIALRLEERLRKNGCVHLPFDIIVASGKNSALPHAKPTEKKIEGGDFVVLDWGGESGGYFSDMTRTLIAKGGDIAGRRKIYDTVYKANKKAIASVSCGADSGTVDKSARDVIKKAGFDKFFGHATGHGIGLAVHEMPRISSKGSRLLKENMVFTIEPGIYVPGLGGVRIEDMVVVRKKSAGVLTALTKDIGDNLI